MGTEQLVKRYFELKQALAVAYGATPWQSGQINRLADQLARIEREISGLRTDSADLDAETRPVSVGSVQVGA